jgi:hypothetical protein
MLNLGFRHALSTLPVAVSVLFLGHRCRSFGFVPRLLATRNPYVAALLGHYRKTHGHEPPLFRTSDFSRMTFNQRITLDAVPMQGTLYFCRLWVCSIRQEMNVCSFSGKQLQRLVRQMAEVTFVKRTGPDRALAPELQDF